MVARSSSMAPISYWHEFHRNSRTLRRATLTFSQGHCLVPVTSLTSVTVLSFLNIPPNGSKGDQSNSPVARTR